MRKTFNILFSVFFLLTSSSMSSFSTVKSTGPEDATKLKVVESYGKLPLSFIENKGQVNKKVAYYLAGRQGTIYFTKEGIVYDLISKKDPISKAVILKKKDNNMDKSKRVSFTLKLIGAKKDVNISAKEMS